MKNIISALLIISSITACKAQINPFKLEGKEPPLKEIQEAIEYNLNQIKIEGSENYRIYPYKPNQHQYFYNYFTEKARVRMVDLFEGKWTEEEIESRINRSMKSTLDTLSQYNDYYKDAKKIAKRDSIPLERVWDSMLTVRRNESRKSILENKHVPNQVINVAGYLKDPRFLPYLKRIVKHESISGRVELALARYGEEPYHSNAIKKYVYNFDNYNYGTSKLLFICSKDAIKEIYNYAMNDEYQICDSTGECWGYRATLSMGSLAYLFDNDEMNKELKFIENEYEMKNKKPDKTYLKKIRAITEKYYKKFKKQEPNCENVPVNAW